MKAKEISKRLQKMGDKKDARFLQGFFKTGVGQYGEGDIFLGIRVPALRKLAKEYKALLPEEVLPLLRSTYHEVRLFALILFVNAFAQGDKIIQKKIYDLYMANTRHINNWDLVDISAPNIVGAFLMERSKKPLYQLAKSKSLWERRIAVLANFYFIRSNKFADSLKIAVILLQDKEDLIHKAVGWMLREVGKRDMECAEAFLQKHCRVMPRTMLRYAIERFTPSKRRMYMDG
ncbi:MAG: DNA alkylation repair protein [Deltaproteobacteria bacterium RBG_19FT_COMBO_43_11]|nr:MAG: DNA alkylation repair protein [Deltaproteobacteria bacterium RBG_16_44_11]OGP89179.1 MAG: DNA alkylation repair protein [Deltaproteobacteria bacterium RBG_19FT_COMBO_43_11]